MHKDAAKAKRVVEFAHVSKSGGTSMCNLAKINGCNTESWKQNCLIKNFEDGPRYFNGTVHNILRGRTRTKCDRMHKLMGTVRQREVSCQERRSQMLSKGYTLYMNEYTALGAKTNASLAHPCSNMFTALQLRHPHTRVVSHIRHLYAEYERRCTTDLRVYFARGHDTHNWAALAPAPMNNYLVRSLLGEAVFGSPLWGVTQEHLEQAKVFLMQQYEVLIVLEDAELSARAMRYGLGWPRPQSNLHANRARASTVYGLPRNMDLLWRLNSLDLELYKYGLVMARLDAIVYDTAHGLIGDGSRGRGGRGRTGRAAHRRRRLLEDAAEPAAVNGTSTGAPPAAAGDPEGPQPAAAGDPQPESAGPAPAGRDGAGRNRARNRIQQPFVRGTSYARALPCGWVSS